MFSTVHTVLQDLSLQVIESISSQLLKNSPCFIAIRCTKINIRIKVKNYKMSSFDRSKFVQIAKTELFCFLMSPDHNELPLAKGYHVLTSRRFTMPFLRLFCTRSVYPTALIIIIIILKYPSELLCRWLFKKIIHEELLRTWLTKVLIFKASEI